MAEARRGVKPPVIDRALAEELAKHREKWAAIDAGRLIAVGETLQEARALAAKKGISEPILFHVPTFWGKAPFIGAAR